VIILLGIKRFEKIPRLLHTEAKLAELIGLERFFRVATARNVINVVYSLASKAIR